MKNAFLIWLVLMVGIYISNKYFGFDPLYVEEQIEFIKKITEREVKLTTLEVSYIGKDEMSDKLRGDIDKIMKIFSEKCQPLMSEYVGDIEDAEISFYEKEMCLGPRCKEYGWNLEYTLKIKIKDELTQIKNPEHQLAWGHTLYFDFGGGEKPGMSIAKLANLCGYQQSRHGAVFVSIPELKFIE